MLASSLCLMGIGASNFAQAQSATPKIIDSPHAQLDDLISSKVTIIPSGRVSRVISGNSFELETGLKVRLAGITAPKRNRLGKAGPQTPDQALDETSLYGQARLALEDLVRERDIGLAYKDGEFDRYGRAIAQVFVMGAKGEEEIWVQEEMVTTGHARVYSWADSVHKTQYLYTHEQEARAAKRGMWAEPAYNVRSTDPNVLAQYVDSVQIVEGIIISTADVRGRVYLNFGSDYKTDFTVTIAKKHRKKFEAVGLDPLSLEGARIRVRGWVELYNGPVIWIDHPERIELLDG